MGVTVLDVGVNHNLALGFALRAVIGFTAVKNTVGGRHLCIAVWAIKIRTFFEFNRMDGNSSEWANHVRKS
jgi:hypothetical protein